MKKLLLKSTTGLIAILLCACTLMSSQQIYSIKSSEGKFYSSPNWFNEDIVVFLEMDDVSSTLSKVNLLGIDLNTKEISSIAEELKYDSFISPYELLNDGETIAINEGRDFHLVLINEHISGSVDKMEINLDGEYRIIAISKSGRYLVALYPLNGIVVYDRDNNNIFTADDLELTKTQGFVSLLDDGNLVYMTVDGDIYLKNIFTADTSYIVNLDSNYRQFTPMKISRDNEKIALYAVKGEFSGIAVIDIKQKNVDYYAHELGWYAGDLSLSMDGRYISYALYNWDKDRQVISVLDTEQGVFKQVTSNKGLRIGNVALSPDNSMLAYDFDLKEIRIQAMR